MLELKLKKKPFIFITLGAAVLNGMMFTAGAMSAFHSGLEGVDNQAAMILIPVFFVPAAWFVVGALCLMILIFGARIKQDAKVFPAEIFAMAGLRTGAKIGRVMYLIFCGMMMLLGFSLFWPDALWAVPYAVTDGILLLLLYALAVTIKRNKTH